MKSVVCSIVACLLVELLCAQAATYTDPVQAYNRLLIEKGMGGQYTRAGNFKVTGSPYFFGQGHVGNIYAKGQTANQVTFSYNLYTQQLEITDGEQTITKALAEIDSFRITKGAASEVPVNQLFVNPAHAGSSEKAFVQLVQQGERFSLYKVYKATLGIVSTNYVQSELRQFDVNYDYYYTDTQKPGLKKLKKSGEGIKKEFKPVKDLSGVDELSQYALNPEEALRHVFAVLNR